MGANVLRRLVVGAGVGILNPFCRRAVRANPTLGRQVYEKLIRTRLGWRDYGFSCRTRHHFAFSGNTKDIIQSRVYYFGIWEPQITALIERRFQGGTFIDIGANVGYFSLLAAAKPNSRVLAFEPNARTYRALLENIALNRMDNIHPTRAAISPTSGTLRLYSGPEDNSGQASLIRQSEVYDEVPAAPFSELVSPDELERTTFIKIDVEGAEPEVIRTILPVLDRMPREVELTVELIPELCDAEGVVAEMKSRGFHAYLLPDDELEDYLDFKPKPALPLRQLRAKNDVLFTRQKLDQA